MGGAKEAWMEQHEGPPFLWSARGKHVCVGCINDRAIRKFIRQSASGTCSFCKYKNDTAAPFDQVVEFIFARLSSQYGLAIETLSYDGREGGYQGGTFDSEELLRYHCELNLPRDKDESLIQDLAECLGDEPWCDMLGATDADVLANSWSAFSRYIMHEARFFFAVHAPSYLRDADPSDPVVEPLLMLKRAVSALRRQRCFVEIDQGTKLYRARVQRRGERHETVLQLGPPPPKFAVSPNRMSPAGVSFTYLAESDATAVAEIAPKRSATVAIGEFETLRSLRVVDLTRLRGVPSIFDGSDRAHQLRTDREFLTGFVRDIHQPIDDSIAPYAYVPTQVVTEFIRASRFHGMPIDGLRYRSVKGKGGKNLVLFTGREALALSKAESASLSWEEQRKAPGSPVLALSRRYQRRYRP